MPKIFYRSRPNLIVSPPDEPLYDGEIDGFRLVEQTEQERGSRATDPEVMYCVCIEADAETAQRRHWPAITRGAVRGAAQQRLTRWSVS